MITSIFHTVRNTIINIRWWLVVIRLIIFFFPVVDSIRLVGGTALSGRVEVFYGGEWGTVCDDYWDLNDAYVVCTELGFPPASQYFHGAYYGEGTGQIWMDHVHCSGTESHISECSYRGWGIHSCSHGEDASVECSSTIPWSNKKVKMSALRSS